MLYNNSWCTVEYLEENININVEISKEDIYRVIKTPIEEIKRKAVLSAAEVVGDNPVICLSGGVDSQTLLHMWHEQNIPYTAVTFEFSNGFNSQEFSDSKRFAESLGIPLKIIKLDAMRFLLQDLREFSKKYNISSPQFAVHAYFLDAIKNLGYTGAVLGGNGFVLTEDSLDFKLTMAQLLDIENYSQRSNFSVIPSFLNFDKDLCIALALATPIINQDHNPTNPLSTIAYDPLTRSLTPNVDVSVNDRYKSKTDSYRNINCKIIPQEKKKTGFEEIKEYYCSLNGNPLAFDRDFRLPLYFMIPESKIKTVVDSEVENLILEISKELNS